MNQIYFVLRNYRDFAMTKINVLKLAQTLIIL